MKSTRRSLSDILAAAPVAAKVKPTPQTTLFGCPVVVSDAIPKGIIKVASASEYSRVVIPEQFRNAAIEPLDTDSNEV